MGYMKEIDRRIRQGGDDAIAAACELSDLAKERRGYEDIRDAEGDITDIVTVLRGVGFAAVSPQAGDSASLLHYCVTHAADEIERLRNERRWIPVAERLPKDGEPVLWYYPADTFCEAVVGKRDGDSIDWGSDLSMDIARSVTHWMPLPGPIGLREPAEDTPTTHATQTQGSVQERCTLTADEREAVKWCRDNIIPMSSSASAFAFIYTATLRKLLERMT